MRLLRALFASKKFVVSLSGILVALAAHVGLSVPDDLVLGILGVVAAYVLGQGIADTGKEAVREAAKE